MRVELWSWTITRWWQMPLAFIGAVLFIFALPFMLFVSLWYIQPRKRG